jgi:hypothetical protein
MADCFGEFGCGDFLAACEFGVGLCEPAHRVGVSHDGQGLFQPLQVLDSDQRQACPLTCGFGLERAKGIEPS